MTDASNMPAKIWADLNSPALSRSQDQAGGFDSAMPYYRGDIVERMAEAASETLAKFDACSDSTVRNTPLGLTKLRSALNSYREASNVES